MENTPNPGQIDPELLSEVYLRASSVSEVPEARDDGETLKKLITEASRNAAMYALLALKTKGTPHERTFLRMASEERELERRLQADHYLLTGDTCPLTPCHPSAPYLLRAIREQYRREQERAHLPLPPLSDLPAVSSRHAARLREMLAILLY